MFIKEIAKQILPTSWKKQWHFLKEGLLLNPLFRTLFLRPAININKLRNKDTIYVLFIAVSPSLWKADSLYRALRNHEQFYVDILVSPNQSIRDERLREEEMHRIKQFFDSREYLYHEWIDNHGRSYIKQIPNLYDVVIYPQPYGGLVAKQFDFNKNLRKYLICCEYAFHSGAQNWAYNKFYQNIAWIDCYENDIVRQLSCKEKRNKGINSYTTGLPFVDEFTKEIYTSPWKYQDVPCKKIIWAPHWTIAEGGTDALNYSNFLKLADFMLEFARNQIGKIQFAFKPHPWLKRELYEHTDWGQERTDAYYSAWEDGANTQLEQGEYVDLFMTSDAMVHDCSSFCCEYLLTGKPVFFMTRNEQKQVSLLNEMAREAFYSQYLGTKVEDLQTFLRDQVIKENDPMMEKRKATVRKYLLPPNGKTAAENIIDVMLGKLI